MFRIRTEVRLRACGGTRAILLEPVENLGSPTRVRRDPPVRRRSAARRRFAYARAEGPGTMVRAAKCGTWCRVREEAA